MGHVAGLPTEEPQQFMYLDRRKKYNYLFEDNNLELLQGMYYDDLR